MGLASYDNYWYSCFYISCFYSPQRFSICPVPCPANNFKTTNGIFIKLGLYIHVHGNEWKDSSQETLTYLYIY